MQGDFSRGFNPDRKRGQDYQRVLLQQGRVLLDSDFNASIDAQDQLIRDVAQQLGCQAGSSDLGYLVTPGQLLACFDPRAEIEPTTTGEVQVIRDYSRKYLDRFPSLRLTALSEGAGGRVTIPFHIAIGSDPTTITLWVRTANATTVNIPEAVGGTGSINVPAQTTFARRTVQLNAASAIQLDLAAGTELWIGLIETQVNAGLTPQYNLARGSFQVQGISVATKGGNWPQVSFPEDLGFTDTNLVIPSGGGTRNLQSGDRLVAYLEIWERHITAVEDSGLIEQALGGLDTCTRTLALGQVKLAPALGLDAEVVLSAFQQRRRTNGTLELETAQVEVPDAPCALPVVGGYTGGDHRLYCFEVHRGGALSKHDC